MLVHTWRINMLGAFCLNSHGQEVLLRSNLLTRLLSYLAIHANRSHSRDELITLLWPDDDPAVTRPRLRVALNSLRHHLEPPGVAFGTVLIADRLAVRLNPEAFSSDVDQFQAAFVAAFETTEGSRRLPLLVAAAESYGGPLLAAIDDDWVLGERERLAQSYLQTLHRLIRDLVSVRDYERALVYARCAVQADNLREEAHRDMMHLFVALGQPLKAIQQYQELKRALSEALRIAPSAATLELASQIAARVGLESPEIVFSTSLPDAVAAELPRGSSAHEESAYQGSLPVFLTHFFGRQSELETLEAALQPAGPATVPGAESGFVSRQRDTALQAAEERTPRLVTLTGPGGTGKTRLVVQAARRLLSVYDHQVCFIPLADVTDARRLPAMIAGALGLPREPKEDPLAQVCRWLRDRRCLLILDNFEHLVESGAALVQTLLETIPLLTLVVTSRRVLGIPGEQEFPLSPLPIPTEEIPLEALATFASVRLFLDRAQAVRPDFQLTPRNANNIAALCRYLEGIPLALELAAARVRTLTPAQMTRRLVPRLELLVNPRADKDSRHRSLRATIAWSVQMLSPDARYLFARLSVFQGGWDVEGAAQVCLSTENAGYPDSEPLEARLSCAFDLLDRLLSESLLIAEERNGTMRFRMLETLREFAWEQLPPPEQERMRRNHAVYWMQFGEDVGLRLNGPELGYWLNRLEEERANLTAALIWCLEAPITDLSPTPTEIGLRIMGALWRFWEIRGTVQEARRFTERLLERAGPKIAPRVLARAHATANTMAKAESDFVGALAHCNVALALWRQAGDLEGIAATLGNIGGHLSDQGKLEEAQKYHEEGLAIVRELGIPWRIGIFLNNLGSLQRLQGDFDAAQTNLQEALALRIQIGDRRAIYSTLNNLAALAHNRQDFVAAVQGHQEALAIARELEDRLAIGGSLINLGHTYLVLKDYSAARIHLTEGLQLHTAVGGRLGQAYALGGLATCSAAVNCPERAGALLGAGYALMYAIQVVPMPLEQQLTDPAFAPLVTDSRFLNALEAGRSLSLEAAISLALQPL